MSLVVQVIVTGLAAGGVYGIVAVGYSLIYRLTGIVYFAFGDLVAFGVFTTLLVAAGTAPVSQTSLSLGRFLFALMVGLVRLHRASVLRRTSSSSSRTCCVARRSAGSQRRWRSRSPSAG